MRIAIDLNDVVRDFSKVCQRVIELQKRNEKGKVKYRYVVTALDRLHNESKPVKKKVKL